MVNRGRRMLMVQDATGGIPVECPEECTDQNPVVRLGEKVSVSGSIAAGLDPFVTRAKIEDRGAGQLPEPVRLPAGALAAGTFEGMRVQTHGVVHWISPEYNGPGMMDLQTPDGAVEIHVLGVLGGWGAMTDAEVEATGVLNSARGSRGATAVPRLWVVLTPGMRIEQPAQPPEGLRVTTVGELTRRAAARLPLPVHRVRLHGAVTQDAVSSEAVFDDPTGRLAVRESPMISSGRSSDVDLIGFVEGERGHVVLHHAEVRELGQATPGAIHAPTLTLVEQVRALDARQAAHSLPVRLQAVVTYADVQERLLFVQQGRHGIFVTMAKSYNEDLGGGELIEIEGKSGAGDFAPVILAATIRRLGAGIFPRPAPVQEEQIFAGGEDSTWVELEGTVESAATEREHITLNIVEGDHVFKLNLRASIDFARSLVNARVRLQGVCGTRFNTRGSCWASACIRPARRRYA